MLFILPIIPIERADFTQGLGVPKSIPATLSTPQATILPRSHDTLLLAITRLIICFLYHLKNYTLIVIQLERLVRHSSSTEETHCSLQVLTEEMKCNPTSFFLISSLLYFRFYFIIIIFSVFFTHHVALSCYFRFIM